MARQFEFIHTPTQVKDVSGGIQQLYYFENGCGASVVRHSFSYGREKGLWELAVIKLKDAQNPDEGWSLDYTTPITSDVLGHLTEEEIQDLLDQIAGL